jgi:hypothetical protein
MSIIVVLPFFVSSTQSRLERGKLINISSNRYPDVGYMIFMLPVNLSLRRLKANRSIGIAVVLFGVVMCSLSVAKSFSAVMGLRFLLGAGQSFIQGLTIYTSLWYRRDELGTRSGKLLISTSLALKCVLSVSPVFHRGALLTIL